MRERLRRVSAIRALRSLPYRVAYRCWAWCRIRPDRILFLSDSHEGFVGNFEWLRRALLLEHSDVEIRGIFKPALRARRRLSDMLRLPYLMATSAVIVLDDFYPLIYSIRLRRGARLVQLWHAAGAFKRVGHSRSGLPGGPPPGSDTHRNYTDAFVSSEGVRADYAEAFGIDQDRVRALGMPRTDFFFDAALVASSREAVRGAFGLADGERLVLVAPTFRGNGQRSAVAAPVADWAQVAGALGRGWRLALREHPFVVAGEPPQGVLDARGPEMHELLAAADVLVTDYSSSLFEFSLLRRPVVLYVPDLEEYTASRAFYRPFERYAIGPVASRIDELPEAIRTARVDPARLEDFLAEFCGALDGQSSTRIARELVAPRAVAA